MILVGLIVSNSPERAVVLCVDEQPRPKCLTGPRRSCPTRRNAPPTTTSRASTSSLYVALDVRPGPQTLEPPAALPVAVTCLKVVAAESVDRGRVRGVGRLDFGLATRC
jgi:hypothetical protein